MLKLAKMSKGEIMRQLREVIAKDRVNSWVRQQAIEQAIDMLANCMCQEK